MASDTPWSKNLTPVPPDAGGAFLSLDRWLGRGADRVARELGSVARSPAVVRGTPFKRMGFDEAKEAFPEAFGWLSFHLTGVRSPGLLVLDGELTESWISWQLGGRPGRMPAWPRGHVPTTVDRTLLGGLGRRILSELAEVLPDPVGGTIRPGRFESRPELLPVCRAEEPCLFGRWQFLSERGGGGFGLIMPLAPWQPLLPKLARGDETMDPRILSELEKAPVRLTALLGEARVTVGDLEALAVGDVIQLESREDDPCVLTVEGRPKWLAEPGKVNAQRGLKILKAI